MLVKPFHENFENYLQTIRLLNKIRFLTTFLENGPQKWSRPSNFQKSFDRLRNQVKWDFLQKIYMKILKIDFKFFGRVDQTLNA